MADRLFADCCYGTSRQHRADEPCPIKRDPDDLERVSARTWLRVIESAERRDEFLAALRLFLESTITTAQFPGIDPLMALKSVGETASGILALLDGNQQ